MFRFDEEEVAATKPKTRAGKATKRKSDISPDEINSKRIKKHVISENDTSSDEGNTSLPNVTFNWTCQDEIAENFNLPRRIVNNVIQLFDQDNTIPFIARYRKEMTQNMDAKRLLDIKENYETLKLVQKKAEKSILLIEKSKRMTQTLLQSFQNVKTLEDVEHLTAPFKAGSKKTLAERARQLGLEPLALAVLKNHNFNLDQYVKKETKGLSSVEDVKTGTKHILADLISKDQDILQDVRNCLKASNVVIECHKSKNADKVESDDKPKATASHSKDHSKFKFENYYNFSTNTNNIKPHQVLAINRGENLKMLVVKILIPQKVKQTFIQFCEKKWYSNNRLREQILRSSWEDAWNRLIEPLLCRQIRSDLTKSAQKASVEVFASNLRQLLLTPPVRGSTIIGIDPGFRNGCKIGVISPTGNILHTNIIYLNDRRSKNDNARVLQNIVREFKANIIAIGNGTASRETEVLVSDVISRGGFKPSDVNYCIVNESGASIYSVTKDAESEMPDLDPNLRSAVSIARRLQEPLAEYVKIEPKHLGVGMYQHDVSETVLKNTLNEVVVECVSFVGVDLNTGSEALLQKVAGLSAARVKNIIEWRNKNGPFYNREQLKLIKGIGPKSFEQCAGFVRILPLTSVNQTENSGNNLKKTTTTKRKTKNNSNDTKPNYLDMTCIHPESYNVALKFLQKINETPDKIGNPSLISKAKSFVDCEKIEKLAFEMNCGVPTMQLIVDGLSRSIDYDLRSEFQTPLFRKGIMSFNEVKAGDTLTGRVSNVVHFGAFVDVGVGQDGLIHISKIKNTSLHIGDRVQVIVENVDVERKRLGLRFSRIL